jgi:predicted amidophosphoribosyltransferase|tara:strand:- start:57 stop:971 length:915 start_codon:yes stop_codon:yes gene_type:complete
MSYVKLTCPSCKNKHEVSNFYLKNNNLIPNEELAKQLCNCNNIKETFDESIIEKDPNKPLVRNYSNTIFNEKFKSRLFTGYSESGIAINTVYNYIPQNTLEFRYLVEFHKSVKQAELYFANKWNKKELVLRHKCQENLRTSDYWTDIFNYIKNHTVDHDNSYLVLRALKERDATYVKFISERLNNILNNKELTICRIPSSTSNTENGCDDVIRELTTLNSNYKDGRKCINRTVSIPKGHLGGERNINIHLLSSEIKNHELLNNKDILLIDDIITTGKSVEAFSKLINNKTKPKSLTIFVFSKTV